MDDKKFKKLDDAWMNKTASLREKKVSEGMLKGFSTSVERRIAADEVPTSKRTPVLRPVWASVAAVMVLASLVVLRTPVGSNFLSSTVSGPVELAQATPGSAEELQEEIEVLKELGVWDEIEDETVLGVGELMDADLELTRSNFNSSSLA